MKSLSCREAGFDCDHVMRGDTLEEVLRQAREHAVNVLGMKESEISQKSDQLKSLIRNT